MGALRDQTALNIREWGGRRKQKPHRDWPALVARRLLRLRPHSSTDIMESKPLEGPISDAMNAESGPSNAGFPRLDVAEGQQAHDE